MKYNIVIDFIQITIKRQFGALTHPRVSNNTYMGADALYSPLNPTFASEDLKPDFRLINQIRSPSEELKPCLSQRTGSQRRSQAVSTPKDRIPTKISSRVYPSCPYPTLYHTHANAPTPLQITINNIHGTLKVVNAT